ARLTLHGVQIAPLNGAERRHILPRTLPFRNHDRVLSLPKSHPQVTRLRLMSRNGVEIGVEMALEAIAIALSCRRAGAGHEQHEAAQISIQTLHTSPLS